MNEDTLFNHPVGFGKYALTKWKDLPDDYLEFLVSDECHTNADNKHKAKIEIKRRLGKIGVKI